MPTVYTPYVIERSSRGERTHHQEDEEHGDQGEARLPVATQKTHGDAGATVMPVETESPDIDGVQSWAATA